MQNLDDVICRLLRYRDNEEVSSPRRSHESNPTFLVARAGYERIEIDLCGELHHRWNSPTLAVAANRCSHCSMLNQPIGPRQLEQPHHCDTTPMTATFDEPHFLIRG